MPYIGTSPSNGVRRKHTYTATASQTSFSGAGAEGATLSYNDSNFVDVYQNGVKLSEADYTSTSGTAIVLAQGASVSDMIEIVVYDVFSVADTVSKADGGQFDASVTFAGDIIKSTSGTSNFAAGVNAGNSIASGGNYNTVVGDEAGTALTTGDNNVAIGFEALKTEDGHGQNVAVGYRALKTLNAGGDAHNTAVGNLAGEDVTTGTGNTLIGSLSGMGLTTGGSNTALGYNSLEVDTAGSKTVAIGFNALQAQNFSSATDSNNTAVGYNAGISVTTGIQNVLIGALAGDAFTDADYNVALGYASLSGDTKGSRSTAIGYGTLINQNFTSATDTYNVAVGYYAGVSITTGQYNTFIGSNAGGANTSGTRNTVVGYNALDAYTGTGTSENTAVGFESGGALTSGTLNTFVGGQSGFSMTTGSKNTLIGRFNGNDDFDMRTLNNHVVLSDGDGNVRGRHNSTTWRWAADAFGNALEYDGAEFYPLTDNADKLGFPNNRWTVVYATTGTINTSDENLKQDIESLSDAELRVATKIKGLIKKYRWKDAVVAKGDNARIHVGAIAQEVEQAFIDESLDADKYAIFCKDEWYEVDGKASEDLLNPFTSKTENAVKVTRLGLRYDQLLAFVIATL